MAARQFAFSYDRSAVLARLTGIGPRASAVTVDDERINVRMGSGFQLVIPRERIRSAARSHAQPGLTRGVHGGSGRWLLNGSAVGLVDLVIDPPVRTGRGLGTLFRRAEVRSLTMSLADPDGFIAAVTGGPGAAGR